MLTFGLYTDQTDGTPIWTEQQLIALDNDGRYSVILGSTSADGLPADAFAAGTPRWLGVQVEGEKEQPRFMLLSVPYALKAGDADTVAGKPASEFVLSSHLADSVKSAIKESKDSTDSPSNPTVTPNALVKYANAGGALTESSVIDTGGRLGIQVVPITELDIFGGGSTTTLTMRNGGSAADVVKLVGADGSLRIGSATNANLINLIGPNVGIGTTNPQAKLEVAATDLFIGKSQTGTFQGATGFDFNPSATATGLLIEQAFGITGAESAGIYMDPDSITMWSAGDNNRLLIIRDEDGMVERFAIDGDGDAIAKGVILTSSRRFKENVAPLTNALDKVLRLQGVTFDWPKDRGGKSDIGFIAEDLGKVLPELVLWEKNGTDAVGVEYANVTAVTVEAIKQLKAQTDQEIAALKAANAALAQRVEALEAHDQAREARLTRLKDASGNSSAHALGATLGSYKMLKMDASFGAIHAGDLLTTGATPGHAMKVTDKLAATAVIGKALADLDTGSGTIPVLVTLK